MSRKTKTEQEHVTPERFTSHEIGDGLRVYETWIGEPPDRTEDGEYDPESFSTIVGFGGYCEGDLTAAEITRNFLKAAALMQEKGASIAKPIRICMINTGDNGFIPAFDRYEKLGSKPLEESGRRIFGKLTDQLSLDAAAGLSSDTDGFQAISGDVLVVYNSLGGLIADGFEQAFKSNSDSTKVVSLRTASLASAGEQKKKERRVAQAKQVGGMVCGLAIDGVRGSFNSRSSEGAKTNRRLASQLGGVLLRSLFKERLIQNPSVLLNILKELSSGSSRSADTRVIAANDSAFPWTDNRFKTEADLRGTYMMQSIHCSLASEDGAVFMELLLALETNNKKIAKKIMRDNDIQFAQAA